MKKNEAKRQNRSAMSKTVTSGEILSFIFSFNFWVTKIFFGLDFLCVKGYPRHSLINACVASEKNPF